MTSSGSNSYSLSSTITLPRPDTTKSISSYECRCAPERLPRRYLRHHHAESLTLEAQTRVHHVSDPAHSSRLKSKIAHGVLAPNAKLRGKIIPSPAEHATEALSRAVTQQVQRLL